MLMSGLEHRGDHRRHPRQVLPQIRRDGDELFEVLVKSPRVDLNILDDVGDAPIILCLKIEETEDFKFFLDCPRVKLCSALKNFMLVMLCASQCNHYLSFMLLFDHNRSQFFLFQSCNAASCYGGKVTRSLSAASDANPSDCNEEGAILSGKWRFERWASASYSSEECFAFNCCNFNFNTGNVVHWALKLFHHFAEDADRHKLFGGRSLAIQREKPMNLAEDWDRTGLRLVKR